jgi:hypothetical protein
LTSDVTNTLRPSTIAELLDRSFSYYRRHFVLFVGISALPNLLALAMGLGMIFVQFEASLSVIALTLLSAIAGGFAYLMTLALAQGATTVAVSHLELGRETSIAAAFVGIRGQLVTIVLTIIAVSMLAAIGFIFLIVPGILIVLMFALAVPVAVLEERGVADSLSRSRVLTKGHRGRIFLIYCLLFVLLIVGSIVWEVPADYLARMLTGTGQAVPLPLGANVALQFGNFVVSSILAPISTIAFTLVYYDERVRKEAFDLQNMMAQLDQTNPPAVPPQA